MNVLFILFSNKYFIPLFHEICCIHNTIIYMQEKLLDSDWFRALQFKRKTSVHYTSLFWIMIARTWSRERKRY